MEHNILNQLQSPIVLQGNALIAYRDPAVIAHEGKVYLYYTLVETEPTGEVFMYTAMSTSTDWIHWSRAVRLTPRDRRLNYSSPGNIVRVQDRWLICLQTYPRPDGQQYGNEDARIWIMDSTDLLHWSTPELIRVKGPDIAVEQMGRMIDPYLVEDRDEQGKWWCFYKQDGVSCSYSHDMTQWTYAGRESAGENVCIVHNSEEYIMFHSPENGIGVMRSPNLHEWTADPVLLTLGQADWPWARGRITAGVVLDAREIRDVGCYVMFFHGTGPEDERTIFDTHACIGLAWSDDLLNWDWPEQMKDGASYAHQ
ncbi:hypothetical protein [Paenibacillus taichungensis]|uniref:hypothetical protein n=1 Tax=Paenibacillus taichungensis TaxID=484184 RepID=UPI0039A4D1B4